MAGIENSRSTTPPPLRDYRKRRAIADDGSPSPLMERGLAGEVQECRQRHNKTYDEAGQPLYATGLAMPLPYTFISRTTLVEHERAHYSCPLEGQPAASRAVGLAVGVGWLAWKGIGLGPCCYAQRT